MMSRSLLVLALVCPLASGGAQTPLGSSLRAGMRLVYGSGGQENPPWTIESVVRDTTLGGMPGCSVIRLRTSPAQATPETRAWCIRGDSLFAWDSTQQRHRLLRPVGPNMTITIPAARGGSATYTTQRWGLGHVDDSTLVRGVLPTVVVTMDSTGRVVRRLRERYSLGHTTALEGIFEVPDPVSGWREERSFRLLRVER